jgi:HD-GYP domain-containing protein (c-di-GMP phosphodiesterase class II)
MLINIAAKDIRVGMFVAELDRPWTDTPFLFQGFLVEDEEQVAQLQSYCKFVYVDRSRSADGVFPETRDATPRPRPTIPPGSKTSVSSVETRGPDPQPRAAVSPGPKTSTSSVPAARGFGGAGNLSDREALILDVIEELGPRTRPDLGSSVASSGDSQPSLFESLLEGIGGLFRKREGARVSERGTATNGERPKAADDAARTPAHHDFIPPSIRVRFHPETRTIEEEMPQARQAFAQVEELSRQLVDDIRAGRLFSVDQLEEVIDDVVGSALRSPDALMLVTRLKHQDVAIYGHSLQVAVYLVALGRHLGLPREELARLAILGLFLDLGKTKIPATLLSKPGPLTPDEFDLVKQHVSLGMDLIREIPTLDSTILDGLAQHHEREDGSGYPAGLRAEGISLYGRMAAIVDTFVALTNPRPYETAVSAYEALRKLFDLGGRLFHAPLVEQFVQTVGVFPVGSRVELSSGEVAVVLQQSTVRRLKPKVLVITGPDKVPLPVPTMVDLLYQPAGNESVHIVRGLPAGSYGRD